jgi:molecular chaperone Hsp33
MTDTQSFDLAQGFTIPGRNARGRVARIENVLADVLSAHAYPPAIEQLLAEALVMTALLGAMLKDAGGQLTLQAQAQGGVVSLLVCDYKDGALRGYAQFDADRLTGLSQSAAMKELMGEGYLAITFDQVVSGERYQGIVPLDQESLAAAAEHYFSQSEQIPSLVRIAIDLEDGLPARAAGLLIQHLPEGEEGRERLHTQLDHPEWEHVVALGGTISSNELTDPDLSFETLIWRLFNEEEEVRMLSALPLSKGCRCSVEHYSRIIAQFPAAERADMANDDGFIPVDCAFCSRIFPIPADITAA